MAGWNTTFLLGGPTFRGYVSFREGSHVIFKAIYRRERTPFISRSAGGAHLCSLNKKYLVKLSTLEGS